jgi:hypothetical protein
LGGSGEDNGLTLHGHGFDAEYMSNNEITVCGIKAVIDSCTADAIKFNVPMLPIDMAFDMLNVEQKNRKLEQFTITHSNPW